MHSYFDSPLGCIELEVADGRLVNCRWALDCSRPELVEQNCSSIEIEVMNDIKRLSAATQRAAAEKKKGSQPQGLSIKQNLLDLECVASRLFTQSLF